MRESLVSCNCYVRMRKVFYSLACRSKVMCDSLLAAIKTRYEVDYSIDLAISSEIAYSLFIIPFVIENTIVLIPKLNAYSMKVLKLTVLSEKNLTNISPVSAMKLCFNEIICFLLIGKVPQTLLIRFSSTSCRPS